MPDVKIENAHWVGSRSPRNGHRHILVKFLYRPEKQAVFHKAKQIFSDTEMFVTQDLPTSDVLKKRQLRGVMKSAYESGRKPVFRNSKLYIDGKEFTSPT